MELPLSSRYSFVRMNTLHIQLKIPKPSNKELPKQLLQKSLTHSSSPLCWSLKKNHARPLNLFLTLLAQWKFKRQDFMRAKTLDQLLLLTNYNVKIQNHYTLASYHENLKLNLISSPQKNPPPSFQPTSYIFFFPLSLHYPKISSPIPSQSRDSHNS